MHMWGNYEQNHAQYQVSTKEGVSQVPVVHSGTVCGYAMLFCLCLVAHPYQLRYEVVCISPLFLSHSYLFLMHNCIRLSFNLFVSLNLHSRSWKRFEVMCLVWTLGTMLMQNTAVDETIEMSWPVFLKERSWDCSGPACVWSDSTILGFTVTTWKNLLLQSPLVSLFWCFLLPSGVWQKLYHILHPVLGGKVL